MSLSFKADKLSVNEIAVRREEVAPAFGAKSHDDAVGGTFTISNLGCTASTFTPSHPFQAAISPAGSHGAWSQ